MPISRKSRIRDVLGHPAGHDLLVGLLRSMGQSESWAESSRYARMRLSALDKLAGPEFVDLLLQVTSVEAETPPGEAGPAWWKRGAVYQIFLPSFMDGDHDGLGDIAGVMQRLPYLAGLGVDILWLSQTGFEDAAPLAALISAAHAIGMRVVLTVPVQDKSLARWVELGADGLCLGDIARCCGIQGPVELQHAPLLFGPKLHGELRDIRATLGGQPVFLAATMDGVGAERSKLFTAPCRGELDMVVDTGPFNPSNTPKELQGKLNLPLLKNYFMRRMALLGDDFWMPIVLETQDTPRIVSRFGSGGIYRTPLAKLLGTLQCTLRGTPMLYQGQELGLGNTRFRDPTELRSEQACGMYRELKLRIGDRDAFAITTGAAPDHARVPMPWSTGAGAGFTGARPWMRLPDGVEHLNATLQMEDKNSVYNHYRGLIALRKANPALIYGEFRPVFSKNKKIFCYFRIQEGEKWYIELNLTENEAARPGRILPSMKLVLSNYTNGARALRPYEANIYKCE